MRKIFVRSAFNYDRRAVSDGCGLCIDPAEDMTKQAFREEVDINTIVRRFGLTGKVNVLSRVPLEGDFTDVGDFHSAMQAVRNAEQVFMEMPAALRKRFGHDPQELVAFLGDDKNRDEAVRLGLVPKPIEKTRDVVAAVDELAARLVPRETK